MIPFWYACVGLAAALIIGIHMARAGMRGKLPAWLVAPLAAFAAFSGTLDIFDALAWLIGWTR